MDITKDNKGTSLVELVIALMISSIVILMIIFFLNSTSKYFRRTNDDVNLQMEAQTIINQLSNLIMEAEYMEAEGEEEGNHYMMEYIDSEDRIRYIFKHINKQEDTEEVEYITIVLSDGCLYQLSIDDWEEVEDAPIYKDRHLLAEHVQSLYIIPYDKSVDIKLELSLGKDTAKLSKKVKFRNAR